MKTKIKLLSVMLIGLLSLSTVTAKATETPTHSIPLQQEEDSEPVIENRKGRRSLARPVMCVITSEGIQVDIDPADIVAYELWDESEVCLISTSDEIEFVTVLYTLSGNLKLRIVPEGYISIGFLSI